MNVLGDATVGAHFDACVDKAVKFQTGALIGHISGDRAYVYAVVPTPKQPEVKQAPSSLTPALIAWMGSHASDVQRRLPGGCAVIGLYLVASPAEFKAADSGVGSAVFECMRNTAAGSSSAGEQIVIKCALSKKLICDYYKLESATAIAAASAAADRKSAPVPVSSSGFGKPKVVALKFQRIGRLTAIDTTARLEFAVPLPIPTRGGADTEAPTQLETRLLSALRPTFDELRSAASICLINGQRVDATAAVEKLAPPAGSGGGGGKKGKKGAAVAESDVAHKAELLLPAPTTAVAASASTGGLFRWAGTITGRVYVHPKTSAGVALSAIRSDLCATIAERIRCWIESQPVAMSRTALVNSGWSLPQRVFVPLTVPELGLTASECVAAGDAVDSKTISELQRVFGSTLIDATAADAIQSNESIADAKSVESLRTRTAPPPEHKEWVNSPAARAAAEVKSAAAAAAAAAATPASAADQKSKPATAADATPAEEDFEIELVDSSGSDPQPTTAPAPAAAAVATAPAVVDSKKSAPQTTAAVAAAAKSEPTPAPAPAPTHVVATEPASAGSDVATATKPKKPKAGAAAAKQSNDVLIIGVIVAVVTLLFGGLLLTQK